MNATMELYNEMPCITYQELSNGILSKAYYDKLSRTGKITIARRACYGTPALVEIESLPTKIKEAVIAKFGDPYAAARKQGLRVYLKRDAKALEYFTSWRKADGTSLPDDNVQEYCRNAEMLNAVISLVNDTTAMRRTLGGATTKIWEKVSDMVNEMRTEHKHNLPENYRKLKEKVKAYQAEGHQALVSKKFGNNNARLVTVDIERLILSLYCMKEKPYASTVHEMYLQFLGGAIEVCDIKTGELYDREDFFDEDGMPVLLSKATIWAYINDPKNRVLVDKRRTGGLEFQSTHRPHHHRHAPVFSFSKISLDDRDLPRKMHDGQRVKAYYAYDVASGAVVGKAYSRLKDKDLFIDCVRDMFRFCNAGGYGMPMEMEVEHHLVNNFSDGLMKAGLVFPFVRWCNPGNSQEKRAEHFNRAKKYGQEKKTQVGIGRFYAKLEANRPKVDKVFDEFNNTYKEKTYSFEQLCADDLATIEAYNNELHPNQKLYPGRTRIQVLQENLNPNLANIDRAILARYIGERTETSIRRSQYVTVQYEKYQLSSPQKLSLLSPNNLEVVAYYLTNANGSIDEVYIYQNDELIDTCAKIVKYNEATAEKTAEDDEAYTDQAKYVAKFDKMSKEDKPGRVVVIETSPPTPLQVERGVDTLINADKMAEDFLKAQEEDWMNDYSEEAMLKRALNQL